MNFSMLQFETSMKCGGQCQMCPRGLGMMKSRPDMPDRLLDKIIKELVPRTGYIFPYLNGEPTMEPRIFDIIKDCRYASPNAQIEIYTTLQGIKTIDQLTYLVKSPLNTIRLSFYGPTPALLVKYQPGLDYGQTLNRIHALLALTQHRKSLGLPTPRIVMHYITTPELMEHWPAFAQNWRVAGAEVAYVHFDSWSGRIKGEGFVDDPKWHGQPSGICAKGCVRLNGLTILSTGDVVPCCLNDERILGNLSVNTIDEIMQGEEWKAIREEQARGEFTGLCGLCDYRRYT